MKPTPWAGGVGLCSALCLTLTTFAASAATITGTVTHVRDGDTIIVGQQPVRLNGVNAPELSHRLGKRAALYMGDLVLGERVSCELDGTTTHDRMVGVCSLNGEDIGADLIRAGLATDCPRYSGGRYASITTTKANASIPLPDYCR